MGLLYPARSTGGTQRSKQGVRRVSDGGMNSRGGDERRPTPLFSSPKALSYLILMLKPHSQESCTSLCVCVWVGMCGCVCVCVCNARG